MPTSPPLKIVDLDLHFSWVVRVSNCNRRCGRTRIWVHGSRYAACQVFARFHSCTDVRCAVVLGRLQARRGCNRYRADLVILNTGSTCKRTNGRKTAELCASCVLCYAHAADRTAASRCSLSTNPVDTFVYDPCRQNVYTTCRHFLTMLFGFACCNPQNLQLPEHAG